MDSYVEHVFEPVYNKKSHVLILGTIPSPKSREYGFYYGHPQNKFWKVVSEVFSEAVPTTNNQKRHFLLRNRIAVWDVLHSCQIDGADDSSIKNPVVNDLSVVLKRADIKAIFTTGKKATKLYDKYLYEKTGVPAVYLPSTSPANCRFFTYSELVDKYMVLLPLCSRTD